MKKTAASLWYGDYINAHSSDCSNSGHAVRRGFPPHFLSQKLRYQLLSRGGAISISVVQPSHYYSHPIQSTPLMAPVGPV